MNSYFDKRNTVGGYAPKLEIIEMRCNKRFINKIKVNEIINKYKK